MAESVNGGDIQSIDTDHCGQRHQQQRAGVQGLSEYTPHTPTFGTLSGHK